MKKSIKIPFIATLLLLGISCNDDFLEAEPSELLSQEQVSEAAEFNPDVVAGTVAGIYSLMIQTGTGGTTNHDDFGQKGYDIYGDMLSGDMALSVSTYGWYRSDITEFQSPLDFTRTRNYMVWRYYYRIIRSTNLVIDALGGNDAVPELDENKYYMGQAKALRAMSYFYLMQYFVKTYNPNEEVLPFYDDPLDQNGAKVTTSVVYDLITSDLTDAIDLLDGFSRSSKNEINKYVAEGLLAYAYAFTGENWQEVADLTEDVINNGGFTIMSETEVLGGFNDVSTAGWMWGVDLTVDIGLGLVSWWGQIDYYSYSYAAYGDYKSIDSDLFAQIPDDDVRKGQFYDAPSSSLNLMPLNKFYDAALTPAGAATTTTSDYVFMRVAEMYLLNAEANANLGMASTAQNSLISLLDLRLDDTSYVTALSGQDLIDEIYLQTRIELWGEGKAYLALKRNHETVVRGDNHLSYVGEAIPYDDERLTFEIPQSEIQNNPFLSTQNE